jgi:hypothetical protein
VGAEQVGSGRISGGGRPAVVVPRRAAVVSFVGACGASSLAQIHSDLG